MSSYTIASARVSRLKLSREAYGLCRDAFRSVVCNLIAPSACCCTCNK
ncbi:hypothetical protein [Cohaesibacter haloalkalitolerans]|nr:hypothetical protein [Cohaesibacter haloalkalitolerans]